MQERGQRERLAIYEFSLNRKTSQGRKSLLLTPPVRVFTPVLRRVGGYARPRPFVLLQASGPRGTHKLLGQSAVCCRNASPLRRARASTTEEWTGSDVNLAYTLRAANRLG